MFYSATPLDRLDHLRKDDTAVNKLWNQPNTRVVPLWQYNVAVTIDPEGNPTAVSVPSSGIDIDDLPHTLLGKAGDTPWFSVDFTNASDDPLDGCIAGLPDSTEFTDLRVAGPRLADDDAAILAYARAISFWQQNSSFCSVCGHACSLGNAGHVRKCQNAECNRESFPRTDPAVIMLVEDNSGPLDKCLLGRSAAWPTGVFSTLAGFVEAGESLEAAVAREVKEEANIDVTDVQYVASQPWPFPRSIMLGFRARATSTQLKIDPVELADAQWFTREEVRQFGVWGEEGDNYKLPRPDSIARFLVDSWLYEK